MHNGASASLSGMCVRHFCSAPSADHPGRRSSRARNALSAKEQQLTADHQEDACLLLRSQTDLVFALVLVSPSLNWGPRPSPPAACGTLKIDTVKFDAAAASSSPGGCIVIQARAGGSREVVGACLRPSEVLVGILLDDA